MSAKTTTLGEHIATQKGFAFKSGWFCDSGRPVVKVKDFTANSVDPNEVTHVSEEIAAQYLKYQLLTGDVVIQTVGSWPSAPASVVGKCVRIPRTVDRALLNQNAVKISPSSSLDGGFLYYSLKNPAFGEYIVGTAQGAASQAAITLEAIRAYKINLPDLPTQRKIAGILSAYDDLIENNLRRIKILEEMAQSLYREWFVHFRFPGHESTKFVDSSLGQIPKGWEVKKLEQILELKYGKALRKEDRREGQYPVFGSSGNVGTHDISLTNGPGIVVGRKGNVGSVFWSDEDFFVIDTAYFVESRLPLRFLFYLLPTLNFINSDAAVPGLSRQQAYSLQTIVPPADFLSKFCTLADSFERQASTHRRQNQNLRRTRDLLLFKLLKTDG